MCDFSSSFAFTWLYYWAMDGIWWMALIALVLSLASVLFTGYVWTTARRAGLDRPQLTPRWREAQSAVVKRAAVVVNPVKVTDMAALRAEVETAAQDAGLESPLWYQTTREDPGGEAAAKALADGADLVIAVGGDGTLRCVAQALAGTGAALAVVPMGTGNVFARNIDLPLGDRRELISAAFTGDNMPVDVGWVEALELGGGNFPAGRHAFLVMAGMGFDADVVGGARDGLKATLGWAAYLLSGFRNLYGRKLRLRLQVGGNPISEPIDARTILFANCGHLPAGIVLLPDAAPDSGWLDIAILDTRGGILGWSEIARKVLMQGIGFRSEIVASAPASMDIRRTRVITVSADSCERVQLDGDVLGSAAQIRVEMDPGALLVRTRR